MNFRWLPWGGPGASRLKRSKAHDPGFLRPSRAFTALLLALLAFPVPGAPAPAIPGYTAVRRARNDHYDFTLTLAPASGQSECRALDLAFSAVAPDRYGRIVWNASGLRLEAARGGKTPVLLLRTPQPFPAALRSGGILQLKRHENWLELDAAGVRVFRLLDDRFGRGYLMVRAAPGYARVSQARYQRIEPVVFGDDFMRTQAEAKNFGLWKPHGGHWKLYSIMQRVEENPDARIREGHIPAPDHIVNPFCMSGTAEHGGMLLAGYPFWDDYSLAVSCKTHNAWMGLVFAAADPEHCWILRWHVAGPGIAPGRVELVHRTGRHEEILASAWVKARPDNWYRMRVTAIGSRITAFIDHTPVLNWRDRRCLGGLIGLYTRGPGESLFDDVDLKTVREIRFDRASLLHGEAYLPLSGSWTPEGKPGRLHFQAHADSRDASAVLGLGLPSWNGGCFQAAVVQGSNCGAGLCAGMASNGDGWRAGWIPEQGGQAVLEHVRNGVATPVLKAPWPRSQDPHPSPMNMALDLRRPRVIKFYIGDRLALRCRIEKEISGRFGIWTRGKNNVDFREVVAFKPPARDWEHPVEKSIFANDPYMQGWASPRWAWIPLNQAAKEKKMGVLRIYQHKGDFYGAFRIRLPISHRVALLFGRDQVAPEKGYRVEAQLDDGRNSGAVILERARQTVARGRFKLGKRIVLPGKQIIDEKIGALPKPPDTVEYGRLTVCREDAWIWCAVDGKELFCWRDPAPLRGRAVGLEVVEPLDVGKVEVHRDHVRDYQFERAAADWLHIGAWEVTNRFACDPRWSFMNGRSKGVAALWNKFDYPGDFTVEYYAGMRMRQGAMRNAIGRIYYPRVGDIDLALCATGRDLFSGYDLLIEAWDEFWSERWTRFLRKGQTVAKTDRELIPRNRDHNPTQRAIPVDWDPGGRPIHGAWYYIKVRKTGNRFDVFFDNVPVFTYTDKNPLAGRRIALWTQDNSIVVARVKIGYSHTSRMGAELAAPPAQTAESAPTPIPELRDHDSWGRLFTFEHGLEGWQPADGDQSAGIRSIPGTPHGRPGRVLEVKNLFAGGDFGVELPVNGVDLGRVPLLAMKYAIPKNVRVNLYMKFREDPMAWVFLTLTGPDQDQGTLVRAGRFPQIRADGRWHETRINLAAALRARFPGRDSFVADRMVIGMLHEGYLNAGLGGNPEGATYYLDDVALAGIGPLHQEFAWLPVKGRPLPEYRWALSKAPLASDSLAKRPPAAGARFTVDFPAPGLWYLVTALRRHGAWTPGPCIPVWAAKPLRLIASQPAGGKPWGGGPILLQFSPGSPVPLAHQALSLTANGKKLRTDTVAAHYDYVNQRLRIDPEYSAVEFPAKSPVQFVLRYADLLEQPMVLPQPAGKLTATAPAKPGAPAGRPKAKARRAEIRLRLRAAKRPGKGKKPRLVFRLPRQPLVLTATPFTVKPKITVHWKAVLDPARDHTPPKTVTLAGKHCIRFDFENGLERVNPLESAEYLDIQRIPRPGGGHALRVRNRICGNDAAIEFECPPFSLGAYPVLAFDYRVTPATRADFEFVTRRGAYVLGFTDVQEQSLQARRWRGYRGMQRIGAIPGILRDGQWHHAEINVAELVFQNLHGVVPGQLEIRRFAIGDWGYAATAPGVGYDLDNVTLVPAVTSKPSLELRWQAADPSGIQGYSYAWSSRPRVRVNTTLTTAADHAEFSNLPPGMQWFGIRALDNAGNWSPVSVFPFIVDNTPPAVAGVLPADGAGAATPEVRIRLRDAGSGPDLSHLEMTMNGEKCALLPAYTNWDEAKHELVWNWVQAARAMRKPIPDGRKMEFRIRNLQDFAGNKAPPVQWTWHIDYRKDHDGPPEPKIYQLDGRLLCYDSFTTGIGRWRAYGGGRFGTVLDRFIDPETHDPCLRVRRTGKGRIFAAYGYAGRIVPDRFPFATFDLKAPPGVTVNLIVRINSEWRALPLTGNPGLPALDNTRRVPADGKWRHVWLRWPEILRKAFPKQKSLPVVRYVALGSWSPAADPVGSVFYVDNFALFGPSGPVPQIYCSTADPTGIAGFQTALTRSPLDQPTWGPLTAGRAPNIAAPAQTGLWYIHVRARDGAGNWGAPAMAPYYCTVSIPARGGDGLEKTAARWRVRGLGAASGIVHTIRAGNGNTVISGRLRFYKGLAVVETIGNHAIPRESIWNVRVYHDAGKPLFIAPCARPRARWKPEFRKDFAKYRGFVLGKFVPVPAGKWVALRNMKLDLGKVLGRQKNDAKVPCREIGFVFRGAKRERPILVLDDLRLAPAP